MSYLWPISYMKHKSNRLLRLWPIPIEFVNLNTLFWPLFHQAPVPYYFNFGPLHLAPITLMRPQLNSQNRVQLKCHAHQSVSMYEDDRNYCVCRKEKSTCLATLRWKRLQTIFFSFLTFPISFLFHSEKAKIWKKDRKNQSKGRHYSGTLALRLGKES